jgi:pilus assembly protein Flp/PilA
MSATRTERGASAVEYGLMIAGIAAVIAVAVFSLGHIFGTELSNDCDQIGGHIQTALGESGDTGCQN